MLDVLQQPAWREDDAEAEGILERGPSGTGVGGQVRQLGELEALVMIKLWDSRSPLSVRDVVEQLQSERKWAYTTVMTVLDRLAKKGLLQRHLDGRSYLYSPALSKADYTAEQMQQVLHSSDDQGTVLLRFVDRMEAAELAALRAALSSSEASEDSP